MMKFLRALNIFLSITAVIAVVGVYAQKHMAELTAEEVAQVERAISKQQADLSILRADWAYLNQPGHIQPIVERHNDILNLHVAKVSQFGAISDLPMRPQERLDTEALDALFQDIEAGQDPIGSLLEGLL